MISEWRMENGELRGLRKIVKFFGYRWKIEDIVKWKKYLQMMVHLH